MRHRMDRHDVQRKVGVITQAEGRGGPTLEIGGYLFGAETSGVARLRRREDREGRAKTASVSSSKTRSSGNRPGWNCPRWYISE